jgi:hypothetical protein
METTPGLLVAIGILLAWNLYYGALIETTYPQELVTLYAYPLWRVLIVIFLGAALLMSLPAALTYLPFLPPTELGSIQQIIYGLAMVLLMMFRPGGLVGGRSKEKSA